MKNITKINFWMDVILFTAFLVIATSGLVLWQGFPRGTGGAASSFWSLSKHEWRNIHIYMGIVLLAQGTIHLALHWTWIVTVAKRLIHRTSAQARRNFAIDGVLFVIFALACTSGLILWLVPGSGFQATAQTSPSILTSRSWKDIHELTGLSMIVLAQIHIGLHWKWILTQVRWYSRTRIYYLEPSKPLQRS